MCAETIIKRILIMSSCDEFVNYMSVNLQTVDNSTAGASTFEQGLGCIAKYKSDCKNCKSVPYTADCLYCLQYTCTTSTDTSGNPQYCCPKLKEALACNNFMAENNNQISVENTNNLPGWAIATIIIVLLVVILIGVVWWYWRKKKAIEAERKKLLNVEQPIKVL
jgi:hypothetical protein